MRRRHAVADKLKTAKRFLNSNCSEYHVHDQGTSCDLKLPWPNSYINNRSFPVSMAERARGAISAVLVPIAIGICSTFVSRGNYIPVRPR